MATELTVPITEEVGSAVRTMSLGSSSAAM